MTNQPFTYTAYRTIWSALDLVFPPACGGCGTLGVRWCDGCRQQIPLVREPFCEACGSPVQKAGLCAVCKAELPRYRAMRSWCVFDNPVRGALHRLKYRRDVGLGDALAGQMADFVHGLGWPIEMVVPIPLGKKRFRERGYNQVGLIARPLAMALGLEYAPQVLARRRETRSQVGLNKDARRDNVRDAFVAGARVKGKTVLVMDDVATTGSTLSAGAEALYLSGAKDVYALTVARALTRHGLVNA